MRFFLFVIAIFMASCSSSQKYVDENFAIIKHILMAHEQRLNDIKPLPTPVPTVTK